MSVGHRLFRSNVSLLPKSNGVAYLHIEDSARGLGFERAQNKDGVEYTSIRWATVEGYLQDFGFHQQVGENGVEYNSIRWERVEGFLAEFGFRPLVVENGKPHDYYIPENIFYGSSLL